MIVRMVRWEEDAYSTITNNASMEECIRRFMEACYEWRE